MAKVQRLPVLTPKLAGPIDKWPANSQAGLTICFYWLLVKESLKAASFEL